MPRPSCPEDICNLSLDFLKQRPIVSITTPVTDTEKILSRWYDIERQGALRSHPWKFATLRTTLTPNPATPPPFGYAYAFDLPNNYIRMVSIGDDYLGDLKMDHVIENGQLLTPAGSNGELITTTPTIYLRYIYDCLDVSKMDPLFIKFFAIGQAIDLAPKFAISASLEKDLQAKFMEVDTLARTVNGQDAPVKRIQHSRILTKRRGLPGGIFASKYTIFES